METIKCHFICKNDALGALRGAPAQPWAGLEGHPRHRLVPCFSGEQSCTALSIMRSWRTSKSGESGHDIQEELLPSSLDGVPASVRKQRKKVITQSRTYRTYPGAPSTHPTFSAYFNFLSLLLPPSPPTSPMGGEWEWMVSVQAPSKNNFISSSIIMLLFLNLKTFQFLKTPKPQSSMKLNHIMFCEHLDSFLRKSAPLH